MDDCCHDAALEMEKMKDRQRSTLKAVLAINGFMFAVEIVAGWLASSIALMGDSLDMLGDALAYAFSLYVVGRNNQWKAASAFIKGGIMALFGILVLAQAGYKFLFPQIPHYETISLIGIIALAANTLCLALLWRHRSEDINMRSVWLCSRNDIIANIAVLFAALGVWLSASQLPDILVGLGIALLFLQSSFQIIKEAVKAYKKEVPLN